MLIKSLKADWMLGPLCSLSGINCSMGHAHMLHTGRWVHLSTTSGAQVTACMQICLKMRALDAFFFIVWTAKWGQ